ncbi:hypothetical protein D3C77_129670 [compost metagenome]
MLAGIDRHLCGYSRLDAFAQQVEEGVGATAGLPSQRILLRCHARKARRVVEGAGVAFDTQRCLVTDGHQQRRAAWVQLLELGGVQCADRSVAVEHPQHRVAALGGRVTWLADPQLVVPLAVGRIQLQTTEAIGQVLAL